MSLYIGGPLGNLIRKAFDPTREVPEEEQFQRFYEILEWLVVEARRVAKENAISYRNFCVGCAVFAFKNKAYEAAQRWRVFIGSNVKIAKDVRTICAEQVAVNAAREAGYDRVIGMVVVGNPQSEENESIQHPTLHPCKVCRELFKVLPLIRPDTIIFTVLPEDDTYEVHTFEELLEIHKEEKRE